jgi:putative transcriptional regulator
MEYSEEPAGKPGPRANRKIEAKNNQMKARKIQDLIRAKQRIETGAGAPASVWEVRPNGKGGFTRKAVDAKAFQRAQQAAWEQTIRATRRQLGLSQAQFARLLGISVRTLHHWEQGTRRPTGAARVLLRVAAQCPQAILAAAA